MSSLEIRIMVPSDLTDVARIEKENFSRPWTEEDFAAFLNRDDADFLVALQQDQVVGYIGEYGIPDEGDITNVSVDRRFRNQKIGSALVSALIHAAQTRGITRIFLEVRQSNEYAIQLYEHAGFHRTGIRKNYYCAPVEDAVLMMYDSEEISGSMH
ncbi:MAG: ribosomal protein S18-alanine N-acetyltransferase [Eubacterium sp.]|nr:ribosomal protein S18-alanine N-acetyltransferase [Eubacterium sp.]